VVRFNNNRRSRPSRTSRDICVGTLTNKSTEYVYTIHVLGTQYADCMSTYIILFINMLNVFHGTNELYMKLISYNSLQCCYRTADYRHV